MIKKQSAAKILIIKLGYSETLDAAIGQVSSLGDVLRTTVVLHLFKNGSVTWLVDKEASLLLKDNQHIRVLIYGSDSMRQIRRERYDAVINFEKDRDICTFSDSIDAKKHYGFGFDKCAGKLRYCPGSEEAFKICTDNDIKRSNRKSWQHIIMEMAGGKWDGEEYILGYKPKSKLKYDIGLNWKVGSKWPNKAWPKEYWHKLTELIDGYYKYSWQEGVNSLYEYIEWINSCCLIVTADSLGQHIALALKRKVLILYGPTKPQETYLYGLGKELLPGVNHSCIPCLKNKCIQKRSCMYSIAPEKVIREISNSLYKNK